MFHIKDMVIYNNNALKSSGNKLSGIIKTLSEREEAPADEAVAEEAPAEEAVAEEAPAEEETSEDDNEETNKEEK